MKIGFVTLTLLLFMGVANAGDKSCQVDLLKPKIKAAIIEEETNKPATMTVAEARLRLKKSHQEEEADEQEPIDSEEAEVAAKADKKESRLGGIFDILLPSKLRNPVK